MSDDEVPPVEVRHFPGAEGETGMRRKNQDGIRFRSRLSYGWRGFLLRESYWYRTFNGLLHELGEGEGRQEGCSESREARGDFPKAKGAAVGSY